MTTLISASLRFQDNHLDILDQTLLPHQALWYRCDSLENMFDAIVQLKVRGAPLIGVAASLFIGRHAAWVDSSAHLQQAIEKLISARPTAVNLATLLQQHSALLQDGLSPQRHLDLAIKHFHEDVHLCQQIAAHGAALIKPGDSILTHCNAGALATAGVGTALGVITEAAKHHADLHVYVDETRPLLQGARLTAWELAQAGVSHQLICDNMAASLMAQGKIDLIMIGADRICANGDFANKIGSYGLAVLAHYHDIPFYVAAPQTTVDMACACGEAIPIEQRTADEVQGIQLQDHRYYWATPTTPVYNPAFDVTPAALVTAYILDSGIVSAASFIP